MIDTQTLLPYEGMDLSTAFEAFKQSKAVFVKNWQDDLNRGTVSAAAQDGQNRVKLSPVPASYPVTNGLADFLTHDQYIYIGYHQYEPRNWGFVFLFDRMVGQHLIYRIDGNAGGRCELVYQRVFLNFQYEPEHFISAGRCVVVTTHRFNKLTEILEELSFLIFVDGANETRFICIEDSMATQGFTIPGAYFRPGGVQFYETGYINLGVPTPMETITITPITRFPAGMSEAQIAAEKQQPNRLNFKGFQWRLRFIDVWGRPSEYGLISDLFINQLGSAALSQLQAPRGVKLNFAVGTPLIDKVELLVRNSVGNAKGFATQTDWYVYDTIEKYSHGFPWYTRTFRTELKYNGDNNTIEYLFFNDKERLPVDVDSTNRNFNPLPLRSNAVFGMDQRICLVRNERDFEPWDIGELEKVTFTIEKPKPSFCTSTMRKIIVWGYIWNHSYDKAAALRRDGLNIVFAVADNTARSNDAYEYNQVLPKDQEGMIAYLVGASGQNYAISKQYKYNYDTGDLPEYAGLDYPAGDEGNPFINSPNLPLQRWEFTVPPGEYLLRFAHHTASPDDDYAKTSGRVKGISKRGNFGTDGIIRECSERIIDCNLGDVDLWDADAQFMFYDFTSDDNSNRRSVCEGYLYEDEVSRNPIEQALMRNNTGNVLISPLNRTDHNGFYYCSTKDNGLQMTFYGVKNGQYNQQLVQSRKTYDHASGLFMWDKLYVYKKDQQYPIGDRFYIKGRLVLDTDHTVGIPGALVFYTRGGYTFTDSEGYYTIIAHDDGDGTLTRNDAVHIGQRGNLVLMRTDLMCYYSFLPRVIPTVTLNRNNTQRIITVADYPVAIKDFTRRGPHMGGTLQPGFILHDWMGRMTMVQASDKHLLHIPTLQETQVFDYSKIKYDFHGARLPAWVRKVSIAVTDDLSEQDYLVWAIDRIQLVDEGGTTNNANPTAIRLYYQGLNEYNKQKNYATNTNWQFLISDVANSSVVIGDEIEFLANGDGAIFKERIIALAQYDKDGTYIQVEYQRALEGLQDGCLVKLIRPKVANDQQFFYEVCMFDVVKGLVQSPGGVPDDPDDPGSITGYLPIYNSYLLNRQIPVPVAVVKTTKNPADNSIILTSATENQLRSFPFLFEHHSPADLWGSHSWNRGRVNARSYQEKKHLLRTEFAVSDVISPTGSMNYIGYFEDNNTVRFDEQEWGGVNIAVASVRSVLVICEHRHFIVGFNDNKVYADSDGQLTAASAGQLFGAPQPVNNNHFGCALQDYNTIQHRNGVTMWLDRNNSALVLQEGGTAVDVSGEVKWWLEAKIKHTPAEPSYTFFHAVIDPKYNDYILTDSLLHPAPENYINDLAQPQPDTMETMVFSIDRKIFKGMRSFIPEGYGALGGEQADMQLISFQYGKPWFHYDINGLNNLVQQYCTFFGVTVNRWIKIIINKSGLQSKTYLWLVIHTRGETKGGLHADEIITEKGQVSRLMPNWFQWINKTYCADFKCATNTPTDEIITNGDVLLDGDILQGKWMALRLTPKRIDRDKYQELSGIEVFFSILPAAEPH